MLLFNVLTDYFKIYLVVTILFYFHFFKSTVFFFPVLRSFFFKSHLPKIQLFNMLTNGGKNLYNIFIFKEKGATEEEMVGCYHRLNGYEFEQTPGDGEGRGSLACCSPWGCKELDTTEQLSWTDQGIPVLDYVVNCLILSKASVSSCLLWGQWFCLLHREL